MNRIVLLLVFVLAFAQSAFAVLPSERLADPALEARARALSKSIRCLVCQNESIDDSNADLAHDLRVLVRERLQAGDTDEAVRAYLSARYGDYVLLSPPFRGLHVLLWVAPALFAMGAGLAAFLFFRRGKEGGAS